MVKAELGPWVLHAFRWMARLRGLRGTLLDPFRNNAERQFDARLLAAYESDVEMVLQGLEAESVELAVKIAALPMKVRGYGHVKEAQAAVAQVERDKLFVEWRASRQAGSVAT